MNRFELQKVAQETLNTIKEGTYISSSGKTVSISNDLNYSISKTKLYTPKDKLDNQYLPDSARQFKPPTIEITQESTTEAALRLSKQFPCEDVCVLNFASAIWVGGSFIEGAKAQE